MRGEVTAGAEEAAVGDAVGDGEESKTVALRLYGKATELHSQR